MFLVHPYIPLKPDFLFVIRFVFAGTGQSPQLHPLDMTAFATGTINVHAVVIYRELLDLF